MAAGKTPYFKRNFVLGVVNGALVNLGMAFLDPFTVVPVFIMKLGGSAALVGFVSALHGVGWFLPQVLVSHFAETRRYLMGLYRLVSIPRVLGFAAIVSIALFADVSNKTVFLTAFVLAFFLAYLAGGFAAVPLLEIISKTIPATRRGVFFGTRRFVGGVLGVVAGMAVGVILDRTSERMWMGGWVFDVIERAVERIGLLGHAFPADFGMVFLLGGVFISVGIILFCLAGEPPADVVTKTGRLGDHLRSGVVLFRRDVNYRRFFLARICWQFTAMAFPFYASYAYNELRFTESTVGLFLSVWAGSGILSNYIWGHIMDRRGNKIVLSTTAVLAAAPPLTVLVIDTLMDRDGVGVGRLGLLVLISSTFFINGFIRSGRLISNITYLLEFAPPGKRPLYVGFMNSFTSPFMLTPVIGGVLIQLFGNGALFAVSLVFALANIYLSTRLTEPRDRNL